jgi:hypothetical protein
MPRLPKDYSKTVIYKIVCNDLSILECYVGHTTDFTGRKQGHKSRCHNEKGGKYNLKTYQTIRENGGWENYSMIEIEKYPCKDANEARAREREWFERLNSNLNTQHPNRSVQEYQKQYKADNREEIAIWHRQHYAENREEILIQQRRYKADNRDNILIQNRQYYADNREELITKMRQYYATRKEEVATKQKKAFTCECGKTSTWGHKSKHFKTMFHKEYMKRVMSSTDSTTPDMTIEDDADTQLVRGICYIPLEEFQNIKQHKDINDDHFYFSNHYNFMHSHAI